MHLPTEGIEPLILPPQLGLLITNEGNIRR